MLGREYAQCASVRVGLYVSNVHAYIAQSRETALITPLRALLPFAIPVKVH